MSSNIKAKEVALYVPKLNDLVASVNNADDTDRGIHIGNINGGIYVARDTTIVDHANAATEGSLAFQLAACEAAGGGIVQVGEGTFNLTSAALVVGLNVSLIGSGKTATLIDQAHVTANGIEIASGAASTEAFARVESLSISMPTGGTAGNGIQFTATQGGGTVLQSIGLTGGDSANWCIDVDSCNNIRMDDIKYTAVEGGVLYWHTSLGASVNYGDSTLSHFDGSLATAGTKGIYFNGVTAQTSINNITMTHMAIRGTTNCIGVDLGVSANRNTFIHIEFENILTGIDIDGTAADNVFVNPIGVGITNELVGVGTRLQIIGGSEEYQKISSVALKRTPAYAITAADTTLDVLTHGNSIIRNTGATAPVIYKLPSPNGSFCTEFTFFSDVLFSIEVNTEDAGDRIIDASGNLGAGKRTSSGAIGDCLKVVNVDDKYWMVIGETGTWT